MQNKCISHSKLQGGGLPLIYPVLPSSLSNAVEFGMINHPCEGEGAGSGASWDVSKPQISCIGPVEQIDVTET